jgi:hypothetical protein
MSQVLANMSYNIYVFMDALQAWEGTAEEWWMLCLWGCPLRAPPGRAAQGAGVAPAQIPLYTFIIYQQVLKGTYRQFSFA